MAQNQPNRPSPQDTTGRLADQQREERDQKLALEREERNQRLSTEDQAAAEEAAEIDREGANRERRAYVTGKVNKSDEVLVNTSDAVEVRYRDLDIDVSRPEGEEESVEMRVNTDLDNIVFGRDNVFTFKRGSRYSVPKTLYQHLDSKGYVWH